MSYPPLVLYGTQEEYREHYERVYCRVPLRTFDGILVRFRKMKFEHCFFESSRRDGTKDHFSIKRAERIDWIKNALQDPSSERYVGWDRIRKCYDKQRRVAIVMGNYIVVIRLKGSGNADFITAFLADTQVGTGSYSTVDQIRKGPKWP